MNLRWYQDRAFKRARKCKGFLLYHQQGTGKTRTALALVLDRFNRGKLSRVLIVGPLSAIDVWEKELKKCGIDHELAKVSRDSLPTLPKTDGLNIVTINYEMARRRPIERRLKRWKPDMVIADECHMIKGRRSKQSKALHRLGDQATYKLGCSGTPVEQSVVDLWSQFRFACPHLVGDWGPFSERWLRRTGYGYTKWVTRKRKLPKLLAKLHTRMDRVDKSVLDLPDLTVRFRRFSLSAKGSKAYRELRDEFVTETEQSEVAETNILGRLVRLQQITGGFLGDEPICDSKVNQVKDYLERWNEKVVVFARFIPELDRLEALCRELGRPYLVLKGKVKPAKRISIRRKFLKSKLPIVLLSQIRVGGVGINELVASRKCLFYSSTFSWIDYDQAISRLHRSGQTRAVKAVNLVARDTIDEALFAALTNKQSTADMILNFRRELGWAGRRSARGSKSSMKKSGARQRQRSKKSPRRTSPSSGKDRNQVRQRRRSEGRRQRANP